MANGASTGAISGAASGAATGAYFGPWGAVVGGVLGGIGGLISGGSADAQQANQMAWAAYNGDMTHATDLYNIGASLDIARMNSGMVAGLGEIQAAAIEENAEYNAAMIFGTTVYQDQLLQQELARVWQDEDLDLEQLEHARARERGGIVADQAASGTVIETGSNKLVVINQKTQEAMDANIIRFNADRKAANILNAKSQNNWNGQVAISQTLWDGELNSYVTRANSTVQAASIAVGANIQARANKYTAAQKSYMADIGVDMADSAYQLQNTQNMIGGLFNAAAMGAAGAYARKIPGSSGGGFTSSGGGGGAPGSTSLAAPTYISRNAPAYYGPGSSLAVGL